MVGIKIDLTMGVFFKSVFFFEKVRIKNGPLPQLYRQYMAIFFNSTVTGLERHLILVSQCVPVYYSLQQIDWGGQLDRWYFFYARLALKEGMIMKVLYKLLHPIGYIIAKLII